MSCDNCRSDIEQPAVIGLREKAELTVVVTDNVAANPYVAEQTPDNTPTPEPAPTPESVHAYSEEKTPSPGIPYIPENEYDSIELVELDKRTIAIVHGRKAG